MVRQFVCPIAIVLIALAGIGGLLMTSEQTQNAVAEKEVIIQALMPDRTVTALINVLARQ